MASGDQKSNKGRQRISLKRDRKGKILFSENGGWDKGRNNIFVLISFSKGGHHSEIWVNRS